MACFKTLSLTGVSACGLEPCETKAAYLFGTSDELWQPFSSIAYSPDHCYCLVLYYDATYATTYLGKYDVDTNTIVQKATLGVEFGRSVCYDATAQKFVVGADNTIYLFDPVTETITSSFVHGLGGFCYNFLYVPQKGKIYCIAGRNGALEYYVGYIDIGLSMVVQLGFIPSIGPAKPQPLNWSYSPVVDCLYGPYNPGGAGGLLRFNLVTNICTNPLSGAQIGWGFWDTGRDLLLTSYLGYSEIDTATDTFGTQILDGPDFSMRTITMLDDSTNTIWGRGVDTATGRDCLCSLDLGLSTWAIGLTDYEYDSPIQFLDGSAITMLNNLAGTQSGIRKVCL